MQAFIPSRSITAGDCAGPAPPNEQQREAARIDAALDRHLADGIGLVPVGDLDDAARRAAPTLMLPGKFSASAAMPLRGAFDIERECRRRSGPGECVPAPGWRR